MPPSGVDGAEHQTIAEHHLAVPRPEIDLPLTAHLGHAGEDAHAVAAEDAQRRRDHGGGPGRLEHNVDRAEPSGKVGNRRARRAQVADPGLAQQGVAGRAFGLARNDRDLQPANAHGGRGQDPHRPGAEHHRLPRRPAHPALDAEGLLQGLLGDRHRLDEHRNPPQALRHGDDVPGVLGVALGLGVPLSL